MCSCPFPTLQIFPLPAKPVLNGTASATGFPTVSGSYGTYVDEINGLGGKGPTPFAHACPAGSVVLGIDVSGRELPAQAPALLPTTLGDRCALAACWPCHGCLQCTCCWLALTRCLLTAAPPPCHRWP